MFSANLYAQGHLVNIGIKSQIQWTLSKLSVNLSFLFPRQFTSFGSCPYASTGREWLQNMIKKGPMGPWCCTVIAQVKSFMIHGEIRYGMHTMHATSFHGPLQPPVQQSVSKKVQVVLVRPRY